MSEKKLTFRQQLIERLIERMKKDPYFDDFVYLKSQYTFRRKFSWGWQKIYIDSCNGFSAWEISATYLVRFNILHEWFEPFDYRDKPIQRTFHSKITEGSDFGHENYFLFWWDYSNYKKESKILIDNIITDSKKTFERYKSIEDIYIEEVLPVFNGQKDNPLTFYANRFFEWLAATKLVAPEKYQELKEILLVPMQYLIERDNPSMSNYAPHLDDIFKALDNLKPE